MVIKMQLYGFNFCTAFGGVLGIGFAEVHQRSAIEAETILIVELDPANLSFGFDAAGTADDSRESGDILTVAG